MIRRSPPAPCSRARRVPAAAFAGAVIAALLATPAAADSGAEPSAAEIAALVERLGADEYAEREAAAARLCAIGPAAIDPLLAAAELSADLEIAMRARWLVDAIPIDTAVDAPEVAKLLEAYKRKGFAERVQVMHRLLRIDDDAGIEPLARIVRLDRSPLGSRVAAALLCREWQPDDPYWAGMRDRIAAGIGASGRPAARFLRAVVAFSAAGSEADRGRQFELAQEALDQVTRPAADGPDAETAAGGGRRRVPDDAVGEAISADGIEEATLRIFQRCRIQMLLAAGRREEAQAAGAKMLEHGIAAAADDRGPAAEETAATLAWLIDHGLPETVDTALPQDIRDDPLVGYAAALAERARLNAPRAEELAAAAFAKPAGGNAEFVDRLQAAVLLVKWGAADWADREYRALLENQRTPATQLVPASIMYSEFLHDQERDTEAAACLQQLLAGRKGDARGNGGVEQILQQIDRDPQQIRSRMHFFESCAAAARGDAAGRRKSLELSLRSSAKDVDALIALYSLPDNTPEQKADAVKRIRRALEQIDNEIQAVPDDSNGYNEYAWLVANTEGDVQKAIRYSKVSLTKSFDSASFLDTLAHCQAAAGNKAAAVRTQSLALKHEPHNRTIRKNLERFRAL